MAKRGATGEKKRRIFHEEKRIVELEKRGAADEEKRAAEEKRVATEEEPEEYVINLHNEEVETVNAPFSRRTIAYIIDSVFFYFVLFQIFSSIYLPLTGVPLEAGISEMQTYMASHPDAFGKIMIGMSGGSVVYLFYFVLVEKELGTTLGKAVMGLKVVSADNRTISYYQAIVRNLTKTILLPFMLIDLLGMFWTGGKQRFSDVLVGTKVIYKSELNLIYGEMV